MKKKKNLFVGIMALIGMICTAILIFMLCKDRIKNCPFCQKFLGDDDDCDFDLDFDEEFDDLDDEVKEEDDEEEMVPAIDEEPAVPKVRRGYIPLKFPANDID